MKKFFTPMRKHWHILLMFLFLLPSGRPLWATTPPDIETVSRQVINFTKVHADSLINLMLYKDRPKGNKDIPVPHFAISTNDQSFVLSIGGQINPIIGGDLGNNLYQISGAGINFTTNAIPVPSQAGKHSDFFINTLNADVDLQIVGLGGTRNQITGYIQFGANGVNNNLSLKKAFISWYGFTAGRKSTLLADEKAGQPTTIDPQGPSGLVSATVHEIMYQTPQYKGFKGAIGLDIATFYSSNGRYYGKDYKEWNNESAEGELVCDPNYYTQYIPDLPAWIEWAYSDYNRIRLSGVIRNFLYRDEVEKLKRHAIGWGIMLSGNLNPIKPLILYFQGVYGKGLGYYIQDFAGLPLSFTPSSEHLGEMVSTPMMGINIGASYNFNKNWQVNTVVSEARLWNIGAYAIQESKEPGNINNYRYAVYWATNLLYNFSSYFQIGVEYDFGRRTTWNAGSGSDSRILTQFMFTF